MQGIAAASAGLLSVFIHKLPASKELERSAYSFKGQIVFTNLLLINYLEGHTGGDQRSVLALHLEVILEGLEWMM